MLEGMRILLVSESALAHLNGVSGSVLRVADHFAASGDELEIIAPAGPGTERSVRTACGKQVNVHTACGKQVNVHTVASAPMPGYSDVRIAAATATSLRRRMEEFRPDVVHLASPMLLGGRAAVAAQKLSLPTVAVYQTDVPGYTARYGMPFLENASWQLLRDVHNRCDVNLAPSQAARRQMHEHGIDRVELWRRGVATSLFAAQRRAARPLRELRGEARGVRGPSRAGEAGGGPAGPARHARGASADRG